MQSLFKPFVAVESPVRYFFVLFVMYVGGWHIADDIGYLYFGSKHTNLGNLIAPAVLMTVITFISRYLSQKKAKQNTNAAITS